MSNEEMRDKLGMSQEEFERLQTQANAGELPTRYPTLGYHLTRMVMDRFQERWDNLNRKMAIARAEAKELEEEDALLSKLESALAG